MWEFRRTIVTSVQFQQILALIIIVNTSKETVHRPMSFRTVHRHVTISQIQRRIGRINQILTSCIVIFLMFIFLIITYHYLKIMFLLQRESIFSKGIESIVIIIIVGYSHTAWISPRIIVLCTRNSRIIIEVLYMLIR